MIKLLLCLLMSFPVLGVPKVLVSIKPLYTVAAYLTKGLGTPDVLMSEKISPHHFHLLPSHIEKLKSADVFVWIGPEMETQILKLLDQFDSSKFITATKIKEISLLPVRGEGCGCGDHHHHGIDPHLWMNPDNMIVIAGALKEKLIQVDAINTDVYNKNYQNFMIKINELKSRMKTGVSDFFIFHDSLQYLEKYLGVNGTVVQGNDEAGFSIKEIMNLKESLSKAQNKIVLTEETPVSWIGEMMGDRQGLIIHEISPEGIQREISDNIYFEIMEDIWTKLKVKS